MKSSNSSKSGRQQSSSSSDSRSVQRGTSSFTSKVPRFPSEKSGGPAPGQYSPCHRDKIKGAVPLSKQLPRSRSPSSGEKTSGLKPPSRACSNSSGASYHSTKERYSTGSRAEFNKPPISRWTTGRTNLQLPFAPPKRTGIVKTTPTVAGSPRTSQRSAQQNSSRPSSQSPAPLIKPPPPLRSNTVDVFSRRARTPVRPSSRLTSGNPLPGSSVGTRTPARPTSGNPLPGSSVRKTTPARPTTAGGAETSRTGPNVIKASVRRPNSAAVPREKSRSPSPAKRGPSRPRTAGPPTTPRSRLKPKKVPSDIEKELKELMKRKVASTTSTRSSEDSGRTPSTRSRPSSPSLSHPEEPPPEEVCRSHSHDALPPKSGSTRRNSSPDSDRSDRTTTWPAELGRALAQGPVQEAHETSREILDGGRVLYGLPCMTEVQFWPPIPPPFESSPFNPFSNNVVEIHTATIVSDYTKPEVGDALKPFQEAEKDHSEGSVTVKDAPPKPGTPSAKEAPSRARPKTGASPAATKQPGPRPRTVSPKTGTSTAKAPRKVSETESFPRAESREKSTGTLRSCTASHADCLSRSPLKETVHLKPLRPAITKRARPIEEARKLCVTFGRPASGPVEPVAEEKRRVDAPDEEEVEINSTDLEEAEELQSQWADCKDAVVGRKQSDGQLETASGRTNVAEYNIDVICSDHNLTITAKDTRSRIAICRFGAGSRGGEATPSNKSLHASSQQKDALSKVKAAMEAGYRPSETKPRPKSRSRIGVRSKSPKPRSGPMPSSVVETGKPRPLGKVSEATTITPPPCSETSEGQRSSRSLSNSSRPSSAEGWSRDTSPAPSFESEKLNLPMLLPNLKPDGQRPAGQYVKDSILLLDMIPQTAQRISDTFHKVLDGLRAFLTDQPYTALKRNDLHEQMMAFINEADGNAFYVRQEVKTELHRCVTQINTNLQELLFLNTCVLEDREIAHSKIEELHTREEQLTAGMEEYRRLNEEVQKKCDDWAYRCRKEQETRRFIEGSKEMVEKDVFKQRKELREAEEEVVRLRREMRDLEKRVDEVKKASVQKDAKFHAKLKQEERTTALNAEALNRTRDEKIASQRTLQQMNESHIRENHANMVRIQDLEKLLEQTKTALENERDEKEDIERRLQKKDDYLQLVEGATVDLIRQTNPGREMPSMPEDFGLNSREVAVWEQLELCRGRLAELEERNRELEEVTARNSESVQAADMLLQWADEHPHLIEPKIDEYTILEQPHDELVEEMDVIKAENKVLKEKLAAKEKHCNMAHEKIEKLQDLLNSLRISETEDADRVEMATLQHQIAEMKLSMREMLERTKEMDLRCSSQELEIRQRDFYNQNQQRLLETRNQVIEVLKVKGRDVSTLESLMAVGDTWRGHLLTN